MQILKENAPSALTTSELSLEIQLVLKLDLLQREKNGCGKPIP